MSTTNAILVFVTVALAGAGPFIAVHRGGKAFDPDEPEPYEADDDDTTQLPRVIDDPYHY
jgi:hypothetical protein